MADRFHLAQNLKSTMERFIRRNHPKITALFKPTPPPAPVSAPALPAPSLQTDKSKPTPSQIRQARLALSGSTEAVTTPTLKRRDRERATTQAKRLALYQQVQELAQQGLKPQQIVQQLGMSAALVRQYLKQPPEPVLYPAQPSKLDLYKAYIQQRFFVEGCHNSLQLLREIKDRGYRGGGSIVTNYVTKLRAELVKQPQVGESNDQEAVVKQPASRAKAKLPSPRQLSWWFCLPAHRLNSVQRAQLEQIYQVEAEFGRAYALTPISFK